MSLTIESVYVIKIKKKGAVSSLYPSERRYSASTVGGLSFVHLGLGILALLLGTLTLSLQGPILCTVSLVPFVTGLLAWRRWYVDRNINTFFYANILAFVVAFSCFLFTVFDIAAAVRGTGSNSWSIENLLGNSSDLDDNSQDILSSVNDTVANEWDRLYRDDASNVTSFDETDVQSSEYDGLLHKKVLLFVNVLVTSLLEAVWSLFSARIAFRGMTNHLPDIYHNNNSTVPRDAGESIAKGAKKKHPAPKPNENASFHRSCPDKWQHVSPRLPLPESNREFRERLERFIANQAAHSSVEN